MDRKWIMWRMSVVIFHLIVFTLYVYGFMYAEIKIDFESSDVIKNYTSPSPGFKFAGHWKYLTHWDLVSIMFVRLPEDYS